MLFSARDYLTGDTSVVTNVQKENVIDWRVPATVWDKVSSLTCHVYRLELVNKPDVSCSCHNGLCVVVMSVIKCYSFVSEREKGKQFVIW